MLTITFRNTLRRIQQSPKTLTSILLFLCLTVNIKQLPCENRYYDKADRRLCQQVSEYIAHEDYDAAIAIIDSAIETRPNDPTVHFVKATIINTRAIDFEDDVDDSLLLESCRQVEELCNESMSNGHKSADLLFYLGSTWVYRAFIHTRISNKFKLVSHGIRAGKLFEEAVSIDPNYWDAYFGLGSYHFYRSHRAGLLRNLHLISDRRQEGISYIELAAEHGVLTSLAARTGLAWIAIEIEDYADAENRARALLNEYPGRRAFLWCLGKSLKKQGKWLESIDIYQQLLTSIRRNKRNNHFNEIGCLHSLAKAYHELGMWSEVITTSQEALNIQLDQTTAKRKKKDLSRLRKMLKEASEKRNRKIDVK